MITKRTPFLLLLFSLLGLFAAGFSFYEHTLLHTGAASGPSLCNISAQFNCDAINKSAYSTVLGVPLAQIGVAFYGLSAIGSFIATVVGFSFAALGVYLIAGIGALALSLYLFFISKFVIGYLCLFCIAMYIANAGIFFAAFLAARGAIGRTIHQGIFAPGEFLLHLISGPRRGSAWLFLIFSCVFLSALYKAPSFITNSQAKVQQSANSAAFTVWKNEPVAPIVIKSGGALEGDYRKGEPGSPIEIVEYSDFECPACRMFYPRLETLIKKYEGKITFVAKNFPLDQSCNRIMERPLHKGSCDMASFVRCAGEQGKFWEAYDEAFTNPGTMPSEHETEVEPLVPLTSWAAKSGLDVDSLKSCVTSKRQLQKIRQEVEEAVELHIESTPTIFVNGRMTHPSHVEAVVESLLAAYPSAVN